MDIAQMVVEKLIRLPKKMRSLKIVATPDDNNCIWFFASDEVIEMIRIADIGKLQNMENSGLWILSYSGLYDVQDIVKFLEIFSDERSA